MKIEPKVIYVAYRDEPYEGWYDKGVFEREEDANAAAKILNDEAWAKWEKLRDDLRDSDDPEWADYGEGATRRDEHHVRPEWLHSTLESWEEARKKDGNRAVE